MPSSTRGICSLYNQGNTCYINAAIHFLRAIPEWASLCKSELASREGLDGLLHAFVTLTSKMNDVESPNRCTPIHFLTALKQKVQGTVYEEFAHNVPHDSHEFMMYLLDKFGESLKCDQPAPVPNVAPQWYEMTKKDYSPLTDLTNGLDKIICTCITCHTQTTRWETFSMLKVPVADLPKETSIEDRLLKERETFQLDDYQCDTCKCHRRAEIRREIWRLPRVLFISLDRFKDPTRKVVDTINVENIHSFNKLFGESCTDPSLTWSYTPIGIIDHHGSLHGGHYTCQIQQRDADGCAKWYHYDDEHVSTADAPRYGYSTYILCLHHTGHGSVSV